MICINAYLLYLRNNKGQVFMKFLSNILLVISIIAYVFCPFCDLGLFGTITGYQFTENVINNFASLQEVVMSLLPFLAGFGAIAFSCMKSRYWSLASLAFIGIFAYFFALAPSLLFAAVPQPFVSAWGYEVSRWCVVASVVASIVALIPFGRILGRKK